MRRSRALILGAAALLVATVALGGVYKHGLNRYSTSEGVSRLAGGYTHQDAQTFAFIGGNLTKTNIAVANADTSSWVWWRGGRGRHGKIARFKKFHVAEYKYFQSGAANTDGPCTLYVFGGGQAADIDTGKIKSGCADTLVWPAPGYNMASASHSMSTTGPVRFELDSILIAPAETTYAVAVYAIGDTF